MIFSKFKRNFYLYLFNNMEITLTPYVTFQGEGVSFQGSQVSWQGETYV